MLPKSLSRIGQGAFLFFSVMSAHLYPAIPITWIATSSHDLNLNTNWRPPTIPGYAVFDSTIPGVILTPVANSNFSPDDFDFINSAQAFTFTFNNCQLQFFDQGILGAQTNTTINLNNNNNNLSDQLSFNGSSNCTSGSATISMTNASTLTGSSSSIARGVISFDQLSANNTLSIATGGNFTVLNTGTDNSTGSGNNEIAVVGNNQGNFQNINAADNVSFSLFNTGVNNNAGTIPSYIGLIYGRQFIAQDLTAGNSFSLSTSNEGTDQSTSTVQNLVGYIAENQIEVDGVCAVGNSASFTAVNSGINSGTGNNNAIGYIANGIQGYFGQVSAGDSLNINMSNTGVDSGSGSGSNDVGYLHDQFEIQNGFTAGNKASITVSNSGNNSSVSGNNSNIGFLGDSQIRSLSTFVAGNDLTITATNVGVDTSTTTTNNHIGYVGEQIKFEDVSIVGDNATISISNSGTSSNSNNFTGYVSFHQLYAQQPFTAGNNLQLSASNIGNIANSHAGFVGNAQLLFNDSFTMGNGSLLSAFNSGTINGSQIILTNGFNVTSGRAQIRATNQGNFLGYGIAISGNNSGGNAVISLENSTMTIDTNFPTFTIGGLNGDGSSTAQSTPAIIINTDQDVNANFAGTIQDNFSNPTAVIKSGLGAQQLSGTNTYAGLTTVLEGTLNLTGSIANALDIEAAGVLIGTGSVGGIVTNNAGTIAPGESIGTLHFLSSFTNNNGNYNLEVNGAGQSDLIAVTGNASINGGTVLVSSADGTYRFQTPYTILSANSVTGKYARAVGVSPLLKPILSYGPQDVFVTLFTNIAKAAKTHNQRAIANQLDGIISPNAQQTLLLSQLIDLPLDGAREALDSLSGYQHTTDLFTSLLINRQFIRRMYDSQRYIVTTEPDCDPCCCSALTTWLEVEGAYTRCHGNENAHGFKVDGYDVTGGIQKTFCCDFTLGLAGSYEDDKLHYNRGGGTDKSKTWFGGIYGLYRPACYYGLIDFACSSSHHKLNRNIDVGTLHFSAHSKPKTHQYTLYGEVGIDWNMACWLIQPFVGIEGAWYKRNHITENNAQGWGLDVNKREHSAAATRLGLHLSTSEEYCVDIRCDLAWNARLSGHKNRVRENFQQFGSCFDIQGIDLTTNSIDYALTLSKSICNSRCRVYLKASGESWFRTNQYNILAGIDFSW